MTVAALNDTFRREVLRRPDGSVPGRAVMTSGFSALPLDLQVVLIARVITFVDFTPGNDPHGEHDFGSVNAGGARIFWKIDYYADTGMTYGSETPGDPAASYRLLTIMLAEEY